MTSGPKKYCIGCGEQVDTNIVNREGTREICCLFCGLTLEKLDDVSEECDDSELADIEMIELEDEARAGFIILAEDSDFLREFMKMLIIKKGLAEEVIACADGQEFITEAKGCFQRGQYPDIVILDVEMPRMNGILAARTFRQLEAKSGIKFGKIPILFFSVHRCDEAMKKQMAACAPARYINKGVDSAPDKLAQRTDQLIKHLLKERNEKGG